MRSTLPLCILLCLIDATTARLDGTHDNFISRAHRVAARHTKNLADDLRVAFGAVLPNAPSSSHTGFALSRRQQDVLGNNRVVYCKSGGSRTGSSSSDGGSGDGGDGDSGSGGNGGNGTSTTRGGSGGGGTRTSTSAAQPTQTFNSPYRLIEEHSGSSFFEGWDFWTDADPTHGTVDYISEQDGRAQNLIELNDAGNTIMRAETTQQVDMRKSIRIQTKLELNKGLWIMDAVHMPTGCGTWPNGGGAYASELSSDGIKIWFWPRGSIPADVEAGAPIPSSWGTPVANWAASSCNPDRYFSNQAAIFDTTFCGDWAGGVWNDAGIPGQEQSCAARTGVSTCEEYVRNHGSAFTEASSGQHREVNSRVKAGRNASIRDYISPPNLPLHLPVELWLRIVQYLLKRDQASLCLTCARLLSITRPLLYRHVSLAPGAFREATVAQTQFALDLLARDTDLAQNVLTFSLETYNDRRPGSVVANLVAMRNMKRLESLKLKGPVLYRLKGSEVERTTKSMRTVKKLEVSMPWGGGAFDADLEHGLRALGDFVDLEEVEWDEGYKFGNHGSDLGMYRLEMLWDVLRYSRNTIHTLSLPFPLAYTYLQIHFFRNYRFPQLRRLTLGNWAFGAQNDLNDFIVAHAGRLEYLALCGESTGEPGLRFDISTSALLTPKSFPYLRFFKGSPACITALANARVESLSELKTYTFTFGQFQEISRMLNSLHQAHGFSGLKELNLEFSTCPNVAVIRSLTRSLSQICGASLERWNCGMLKLSQRTAKWGPSNLSDIFVGFFSLIELRLGDGWLIGSQQYCPTESEVEAYLLRLGSVCPRLQDVHFEVEGRKCHWQILKTQSGLVSYRQL
ncbi:hypothetical protein VNI00_014317 [Paramarasmius palmivorus]|uniref:F-box domain-containing protein n=1 Tax=Paramarasmius palmivorus TaxID=297713 RepID=A0AAW0BVR5_9AGAR